MLNRATLIGIDPQRLLKNGGINIEQKANIEELQKLALNGIKMAQTLFAVAAKNIQNRSKLGSSILDSVKNPFQTKNIQE